MIATCDQTSMKTDITCIKTTSTLVTAYSILDVQSPIQNSAYSRRYSTDLEDSSTQEALPTTYIYPNIEAISAHVVV